MADESSPSNLPETAIRFVPEGTNQKSRFTFGPNPIYARSRWGIITTIQMLSSLSCFIVTCASRTHTYEISGLVVYVAPKATPLFIMAFSFCAFYVDALIILAASLSNFSTATFQRSLFYLMFVLSVTIFYLCSALVMITTYNSSPTNYAIMTLTSICCTVFTLRSVWVTLQVIKIS